MQTVKIMKKIKLAVAIAIAASFGGKGLAGTSDHVGSDLKNPMKIRNTWTGASPRPLANAAMQPQAQRVIWRNPCNLGNARILVAIHHPVVMDWVAQVAKACSVTESSSKAKAAMTILLAQ